MNKVTGDLLLVFLGIVIAIVVDIAWSAYQRRRAPSFLVLQRSNMDETNDTDPTGSLLSLEDALVLLSSEIKDRTFLMEAVISRGYHVVSVYEVLSDKKELIAMCRSEVDMRNALRESVQAVYSFVKTTNGT